MWDDPNDDPSGGLMVFTFTNAMELLSVDVIDIDGSNTMTFVLTDTDGDTRTYFLPGGWTGDIEKGAPGWGTLDLTLLAAQAGPQAGVSSVNDVGTFDVASVASLSVTLSGSGAITNVSFVPEPSSLMLFSVVCLGMCRRRRS